MRCLTLSLLCLVAATPAFAQKKDPIPLFVIDARGAFASLKADSVTASSLGITSDQLPGHAFGIVAGAHVYPFRRGGFAFGLGGELVLAKASDQQFDVDGVTPLGPEVHRQLRSVSGQFSLNFGHRQGWSYISAGSGPTAFDTYLADATPDRPAAMTINFGFGARWFNNEHLAFCLDLRFYQTPPALPTAVVGERGRTSLLVMSAGVAFK